MSNIEHWERLAVLSWDRQGMPQTVRALTPGGMALREGETEYVRADLHAGAVARIAELEADVARLGTELGRWREETIKGGASPGRITVTVDRHGEPIVFGAQEGDGCSAVEYVRADAVGSRIARARGLAQAIAECRDDARLDGVRECAAEIVQLLGER